MSINETLFETVKEYSVKYFFFGYELEDFLKTSEPFPQRQKKAKILIRNIMTKHGKADLFKYVTELARVEYDSRKLAPSLRDHVVHAMLTFILGIYINEKFLTSSDIQVEPFQWKLASLFHDIGYPVHVANNDLLKPFERNIQKIIESFDLPNKNLHFKIVPEGFEKLTNNKNSFELINKRLKEWKLRLMQKMYTII